MSARVRIRDVADHAGVSSATVSLVLNGKAASIGEATRQRVERSAAELGYRPNVFAQSLRSQRSLAIGVLSDRVMTTPYAGAMIEGAQSVADDRGYALLLANADGADQFDSSMRAMSDRQVDGVIYASMFHQVIELPPALQGLTVVMLDARASDDSVSAVVPDEIDGATQAVEHLIDAGHRRIAMINDEARPEAALLRERAYRDTLVRHGCEIDERWIVSGPSDTVGGRAASEAILAGTDRPTAIFAFNDRMAVGAYLAAASLGIRIPEELSVVGFDDQELLTEAVDPPLTSVRLPHREMGRWAMEQVLTLLDEQAGTQLRRMPCPLVERGSVAPPNNRNT